jgi:TolB-like protein
VANVFISKQRGSDATAARVAAALRAAGHQPWSDAELPLDRPYAEVIEERLAGADRVLVLWTAAAARSQWVRAEAEFAREHGKLVQARLDAALPPIPFNQIQCADLSGWAGDRRHGEWRKVLASVAQPIDDARTPPQPSAFAPAASAGGRTPWAAIAAVVAVAALALGGLAWWRLGGAPQGPARIAVLPFEAQGSGADTRGLADGLTDQILTVLNKAKIPVVSREVAAGLRGAGHEAQLRALDVALVFDGTVRGDGKTTSVSVHIDDPFNHATLWSGGREGLASDGQRLQERVAKTMVNVMACSHRALQPTHGLRDPALLGRYLRACDIFANEDVEVTPNAIFELLSNLRLVSAKAPDFTAAHSDLAKFDAYLAPTLPPEQGDPLRREAAAEAKKALALDPKSPDAYLAQAMLQPPTAWAAREALLRKGVAADPDWPHTNGFLFQFLLETGRMAEAAPYAARAAAADLQIDWTSSQASADCQLGRFDAALSVLRQEYEDDPKSAVNWGFYVDCLTEAGRYADVMAMNEDPSRPQAYRGATEVAVKALVTKAPADREAARRTALVQVGHGAYLTLDAIRALTLTGFLDNAFTAAERFQPSTAATSATTGFLFSPEMVSLRRDPRFMRLAARLGLVAYWRATGRWPDFCVEPGLPYDCKTEADRL